MKRLELSLLGRAVLIATLLIVAAFAISRVLEAERKAEAEKLLRARLAGQPATESNAEETRWPDLSRENDQ